MPRQSFPAIAALTTLLLCSAFTVAAEPDPYENYVKTSQGLPPVKQDKDWLLKAYPSWMYMPWTHQWTIGYTDDSGKWSLENGYNGAFVDWGDIDAGDSKTGRLDWINKYGLHFYVDHLAGKRELHLWDGGIPKNTLDQVHGNGVRVNPVNDAMRQRLQQLMTKHIAPVKSSPPACRLRARRRDLLGPLRASDHVVRHRRRARPIPAWLKEIYGPQCAEARALGHL